MKATIWNGAFHGPGLYLGTPMDVYREDPCPEPSLNRTIAQTALFRSLERARALHPRLTDPDDVDCVDEDDGDEPRITRAMDIGSAAHALAFGVGSKIAVVHARNWRTKEAREARKAARAVAEIPLLEKEYRRAKAMADRSGPVITALLEGSVVAEAMVCVQDNNGFWRRILIDRARADMRVLIDFKTTGMAASPSEACDAIGASKHYFQEAFYRRVLDLIDPDGRGRRRFCFLFQEQEPPFPVTLVETDEAYRSLGDEQVEAACNLWDRALATGEWPGHSLGPHIATPKPWLLEQWARRAEVDETLNPMELA